MYIYTFDYCNVCTNYIILDHVHVEPTGHSFYLPKLNKVCIDCYLASTSQILNLYGMYEFKNVRYEVDII